ncbi:MAG: peptidase E [Fimbriimonadaceae bacterium]
MHVFALGGGDLRVKATLGLDLRIVGAAGNTSPRALFIPTASDDDPEYCDSFLRTYRDELGCETDLLLLWRERPSDPAIGEKIGRADLIYVGGGNSRKMLALWRELGVDALLRTAGERGTVLSGLSAGANCWFKYCNSDWPLMEGRTDKITARLECMGLFELTMCPHMRNEEFRPAEFRAMMRDTPGVGIGVDDCAAFEILGDTYRIVSCAAGSGAHRVFRRGEDVVHERLEPHDDYRLLRDLQDINISVDRN